MAKQCLRNLYMVVFIFALAACVVTPSRATPTPRITTPRIRTPRITFPGEAIFYSCRWSGRAEAWIDENANGIWDEGEAPLPGVRFSLKGDVFLPNEDRVSNKEGKVRLYAEVLGKDLSCHDVHQEEAEIYPEVPSGYRLTTEHKRKVISGEVVQFGLVSLVPAATSMPTSTATP